MVLPQVMLKVLRVEQSSLVQGSGLPALKNTGVAGGLGLLKQWLALRLCLGRQY